MACELQRSPGVKRKQTVYTAAELDQDTRYWRACKRCKRAVFMCMTKKGTWLAFDTDAQQDPSTRTYTVHTCVTQ